MDVKGFPPGGGWESRNLLMRKTREGNKKVWRMTHFQTLIINPSRVWFSSSLVLTITCGALHSRRACVSIDGRLNIRVDGCLRWKRNCRYTATMTCRNGKHFPFPRFARQQQYLPGKPIRKQRRGCDGSKHCLLMEFERGNCCLPVGSRTLVS